MVVSLLCMKRLARACCDTLHTVIAVGCGAHYSISLAVVIQQIPLFAVFHDSFLYAFLYGTMKKWVPFSGSFSVRGRMARFWMYRFFSSVVFASIFLVSLLRKCFSRIRTVNPNGIRCMFRGGLISHAIFLTVRATGEGSHDGGSRELPCVRGAVSGCTGYSI